MKTLKKPLWVAIINTVLFSVLILLHYSGVTVKIGTANPFAALALLVAVIMFSNEVTGVLTGALIGIVLDSMTSTPIGFNTITLIIVSFCATLISHYLFNRNLKAAIALCLIFSALYFSARWMTVFALKSDIAASFKYLINYAATSTVYTTVFVIPFFYLEKKLFSNIG